MITPLPDKLGAGTACKLYSIANWSTLYENNRSRVVADLRWVPIPNKLDGEHFSAIMNHPQGAVIFAGFILLVEIASRCAPRGTLTRSNGQPHTPETLAQKCRCPAAWFATALDYLEKQTDWLHVTEASLTRQRPVIDVVEACHPSPAIVDPVGTRCAASQTLFEQLKSRITSLYMGGGTAPRRWSNYEEQMLAEIARTVTAQAELNLILNYRESLPPAERIKYFPQSATKLLEKWHELLDRARLTHTGAPLTPADKEFEKLTRSVKNL